MKRKAISELPGGPLGRVPRLGKVDELVAKAVEQRGPAEWKPVGDDGSQPSRRSPAASRPARTNPFRTERIEALALRLHGTSWPELLDRFDALDRRAALVGPKGHGKTTLLEEVERRFASRGWRVCRVRLNARRRRAMAEERQAVEEAGEHVFVTIDGAEQLSWLDWRRLRRASRRAGALLVTTHRPGLLPTLYQHRTSPELLRDLVGELVGVEQRPRENELARLFEAHGGNVRECLRELYDRWSDLPAMG